MGDSSDFQAGAPTLETSLRQAKRDPQQTKKEMPGAWAMFM